MVYNPYWRAAVDGVPRAIIPLNGAFLGVLLAGHEKSVEFRYDPPYRLFNR
jgi:hypothetical protein